MFIFHRRLRAESTDVFDICLQEDTIEDAERRFGPALNFFVPRSDDRYHILGWVVLVHKESKDEVEFFLSCKDLSETEKKILWRELEMLVGNNCYTCGSEPEIGWFMNDSLK